MTPPLDDYLAELLAELELPEADFKVQDQFDLLPDEDDMPDWSTD